MHQLESAKQEIICRVKATTGIGDKLDTLELIRFFDEARKDILFLIENCGSVAEVRKCLKRAKNNYIIDVYFYYLIYCYDIIKIRVKKTTKAELEIDKEVEKLLTIKDYRLKLWGKEKDEGFFNYVLESMFKDLKISKSSISFIYYCVQNDFAAEDYRAKFEAYVNHVVTKKYKIKGKFKVQSRATITSIDDKIEAFNKAQNKWNELNEHHIKDHYVPHFS